MSTRTVYRWNSEKTPYDIGKTPSVSRDFVIQVAQAASGMDTFTFDDIYARFPEKKELRIYLALKYLNEQELTYVAKRGRGKWLTKKERTVVEEKLQGKESIYKVATDVNVSPLAVYFRARKGDYIQSTGRGTVLPENFPEYFGFVLDKISTISKTGGTFSAREIDPVNPKYAGRFLVQLARRGQLYTKKIGCKEPAYSLQPIQEAVPDTTGANLLSTPKVIRRKTSKKSDSGVLQKDIASVLTQREIEQIASGRIGGIKLG